WSPADSSVDEGQQLRQHRFTAWGQVVELPPPLSRALLARIGGSCYMLEGMLGQGTYACVWAACQVQSTENVPAAIKEMRCGVGAGILPGATLERAQFEVSVMTALAAEPGEQVMRAPRMLSHQWWAEGPHEPGAYLFRVAMTRCEGMPMEHWLHRRCEHEAS
ncbi:unnamed protein product, partial [Polarella glacialis]